ncbi:nucleoporin subcomplex protein binding to Pom34-domain-containing protein [Melampsora americana]|nr:nucleoporin subcomplex protein binding to Pom34-domain-containing protein [Melampsora americana]
MVSEVRQLALISNPIRLINRVLAGCSGSSPSSSTFVQQLLELHRKKLRTCYDAFPSTSSESRAKVSSGKVALPDGEVIVVSEKRKANVFKISETFNLCEVESLVIWLQFLNHRRISYTTKPDQSSQKLPRNLSESNDEETLDEETLGALASFYFEERQSVLVAIASMLHIEDNESSPIFEICLDFLNSIITPDTPSIMLTNFIKRTKSVLPESVRASPRQATFWAKQLIREQKLVLEVVFLLFYGRIKAHGSHYVSALSALKITTWGQNQESFAFFDDEASAIGVDIANLLTLITLQVSHIEDVSSHDFSLPSEALDSTNLFNPGRLKDVHDLQMELLQHHPFKVAPIALAWTFVLHKMTVVYLENGIPPSHTGFAELILPLRRANDTQDQEGDEEMEQSEESLPLYQRWGRHILSAECELFHNLSQLISSVYSSGHHKRFGAPDNNALGYLVTIRVLFSAMPLFFRLMYFSSQQFEGIINAFGLLFRLDTQHAIASEFWKAVRGELGDISENDLPLATGEAEFLESARSRFPINVSLFTKICRSVSGFSETRQLNATDEQRFCVQSLVQYVDQLSTLTEAIPNSQSSLLPLTYEPTTPPEYSSDVANHLMSQSDGWVRATREIKISPSVHIPRDTLGKIVSSAEQNPVVICWQYSWSAWQYWGDLVLYYSGYHPPDDTEISDDDVFRPTQSANPDWAEDKVNTSIIVEILQILTALLESKPEAGSDLIRRIVSNGSHLVFIQAVFNIIESSIHSVTQTLQTETTEAAMRLVSALLPIFPGAIWTLIRGSSVLFPALSKKTAWNQVESSTPILNFERLSGRYGITLSALDTAHMLIFEATNSGLATNPAFAEIKTEVLLRALVWIRDEIWPGFQNWKYIDLDVKFRFATKCCRIFNAIASHALKTHLNIPDLKTDLVAREMISFFSEAFVTSPVAITLNPMIVLITTDAEVLDVLQRTHRIVEYDALVESIFSTLALAKNILALRPHHLLSDQAGMLERLLLTQSIRKSTPGDASKNAHLRSALPYIAYWCLDGPNDCIAKTACEVLSLLCKLSKDWSSDWPSISASFGDPVDMSEFLISLAREGAMGHEQESLELQSTLWDLLAVIVDTQPSLAAILITGQLSLPGWGDSDPSRLIPAGKSSNAPESALQVAIEAFVKCFQDDEAVNLSLGLSVLSFLDTVHGRVNEFETTLIDTAKNKEFTDRIISISTSLIITPPILVDLKDSRLAPFDPNPDSHIFGMVEELQVKHHCDELICRAYSTRILTVLLQLEASNSKGQAATHPIQDALIQEMQKSDDSMKELIISTIESMADPELQSEALREICHRSPNLDLESYRRIQSILPHENVHNYGRSFVYDYEMMSYKIEGSGASAKIVDEVLKNIVAINWNLSVVDAQLEVTQAWQGLLEVALRQTSLSDKLIEPLSQSILALSHRIASESRQGEFMVNIHSVRLSILLVLIQALPDNSKTTKTTLQLLEPLKNLLSSECFPVVETLKRRTKAIWQIDVLKLVYVVLRRCRSVYPLKLSDEERYLLVNTIENLLRSSLTILETVLILANLSSGIVYDEELKLIVSIVTELLASPVRPATTHWAHRIHDFCQPAFNLLNQRVNYDEQEPKLVAEVIRLFMGMSLDDRLAEYLASEGLIAALLGSSLTPKASLGLIEPVSPLRPNERNPVHTLWCSVLALVCSLANTLCHSELFMVDEIASFAKLYSPQLMVALSSISTSNPNQRDHGVNLSLAVIEEMELVTSLLSVICTKPIGHPFLSLPENFCLAMMTSLQTLAHCLSHPNSTSKWLENDVSRNELLISSTLTRDVNSQGVMMSNSSQKLDVHLQEALLHMLQISKNILHILISHTRAIHVLTRDIADWPLELTVLNPTRSIVAGEPATIGTLLELAETGLEVYRSSANASNPTTLRTISGSSSDLENDTGIRAIAETVLESSLLLAATQLALWLHHPSHPAQSPTSTTRTGTKENESSTNLNTFSSHSWSRLKREIVTDLSPDLMTAIDKSINSVKTMIRNETNQGNHEQIRLVQNFKQSVLSKKTKPFVLSTSTTSQTNTRNEMNEEEEEKKKNGVEQVLMAVKSFSQSNLMTET